MPHLTFVLSESEAKRHLKMNGKFFGISARIVSEPDQNFQQVECWARVSKKLQALVSVSGIRIEKLHEEIQGRILNADADR